MIGIILILVIIILIALNDVLFRLKIVLKNQEDITKLLKQIKNEQNNIKN